MKSLHLTTRISADGMLHLPVAEFADREVEVIVLAAAPREMDNPLLCRTSTLSSALQVVA